MKTKKKFHRPLPLKQRTASIDQRRDFNTATWWSVLGLLKVREFIVTVDNFSIWRRHLAWAYENGKELRDHMTQRFASSMVFMSLLLSTELSVLFNSAAITTNVRHSLQNEEYWTISFWIGIFIIFSAVLTLLSLISTYTAWSMVSSVHQENAHCIFRSSIGQYVAELPGRLIVGSIYSFLLWVTMFFFLLIPIGAWSIALAVVSISLFVHTICCLSAFGRIIMHSGAMGHNRIFEQSYERILLPHSLHTHLLAKAKVNLSKNTSIRRQYQSSAHPIDHFLGEDEMSDYLQTSSEEGTNYTAAPSREVPPANRSSILENTFHNNRQFHESNFEYPTAPPPRKRTDSTVRFADEVDVVIASPDKKVAATNSGGNNQRTNETSVMSSVPEVDTPTSQLSLGFSSFGESTVGTTADSTRSSTTKTEPIAVARSLRPGGVQRDRSNTTAICSDMETLFQGNESSNVSPEKPAGSSRITNSHAVRAESDRVVTTDWLHKGNKMTSPRRSDGHRRSSLPTRPPPWPNGQEDLPGLSVLENAAKLQRQWQNSHVNSSQPPSAHGNGAAIPPRQSLQLEKRMQQMWLSPTPRAPIKPAAVADKTQSQASGAETSNLSEFQNTQNHSIVPLSAEEEEAYRLDYGSFERLPDMKTDQNTWTTTHPTEAACLLEYDCLEQAADGCSSFREHKTDNDDGDQSLVATPKQGSCGNGTVPRS